MSHSRSGLSVKVLRNALTNTGSMRDWRMFLRMLTDPNSREALALQYIRGTGIEIGALHCPLRVPARARVIYVDRLPVSELRLHYPELNRHDLVEVDIVADGEKLSEFKAESFDFVIANHFLEHCENPIGTVESFSRVLKPKGVLYLSVPDKNETFDRERTITELQHLIRDYREGPEWSRDQHLREWRSLVQIEFGKDSQRSIETLTRPSYSIHFHVWTSTEFLELIVYLIKELKLDLELEKFIKNGSEIVTILRKSEFRHT